VQVGDLVKMRLGHSAPGVVIEIPGPVDYDTYPAAVQWVRIHWSDDGLGVEKMRDLDILKSKLSHS